MKLTFYSNRGGLNEYSLKTIHCDYIISEREVLQLQEDIKDALVCSGSRK